MDHNAIKVTYSSNWQVHNWDAIGNCSIRVLAALNRHPSLTIDIKQVSNELAYSWPANLRMRALPIPKFQPLYDHICWDNPTFTNIMKRTVSVPVWLICLVAITVNMQRGTSTEMLLNLGHLTLKYIMGTPNENIAKLFYQTQSARVIDVKHQSKFRFSFSIHHGDGHHMSKIVFSAA